MPSRQTPLSSRIRIAGAVLPLALMLGACGASSATVPRANASIGASSHPKHGAHKVSGTAGVITALTTTSITLRTHGGLVRTFAISTSTRVRAGKGVTETTLVVGERVRVLFATGSTTAVKAVVILPPKPAASPSA